MSNGAGFEYDVISLFFSKKRLVLKKYKCIVVKSQTYARKAEKILARNGISAFVVHCTVKSVSGCGRCVKVEDKNTAKAVALLKAEGIILTGEIYDL